MSCKGCADRKASLQRWLRGLIGAAGHNVTDLRLRRLDERTDDRFIILSKAYAELRDQHNVLDKTSAEWFGNLEQTCMDLTGRMITLRALNKDAKDRIRELAVMVEQNERDLSELVDTVESIEFPEFQPVEHKIDTSGGRAT